MFAKNLEIILCALCEKSDFTGASPNEVSDRFNSLRGYGMLPRGREKRDQPLTNGEVAASILGLATTYPRWAGHAATVLCNMLPVGGASASFFGASTLRESIGLILEDAAARDSVVKLTVSGAERAINSNGSATLQYEISGAQRWAFFVRREAVSLMQSGAEKNFDADQLYSPMRRETTFGRAFFDRIVREIINAKAFPALPAGDGSEYDAEEIKQARYRKLGVIRGSRFLNVGVDNQVTWPKEETLVQFDRYHLVLMPKTSDFVQSIHVDLTTNKLTTKTARTVINRFLSIMTWCDDGFAIAQDGWAGNPIPVAVRRRDLAFLTAHQWLFERKIPSSADARRALALYREARNAQQNFMISYAV